MQALPGTFDPLSQCLRAPAERRVTCRFVPAPRLVAGYDASGQRVLVEIRAQARHGVGEPARVDANKRACCFAQVSCSSRLFMRPRVRRARPAVPAHASRTACQAGRVDIALPPHWLHRRRWPACGTNTVSGRASTLTSAACLQASQVAMTARTPFWRMFARLMGGPEVLLRRVTGVETPGSGTSASCDSARFDIDCPRASTRCPPGPARRHGRHTRGAVLSDCKRRSNNPSLKRPDFPVAPEQKSGSRYPFALDVQRVGDEGRGA